MLQGGVRVVNASCMKLLVKQRLPLDHGMSPFAHH